MDFDELYNQLLVISKRNESARERDILLRRNKVDLIFSFTFRMSIILNPYRISYDSKLQVDPPNESNYENYRRFFTFRGINDLNALNITTFRYLTLILINTYIVGKFLIIGTVQLIYEKGIKLWRYNLLRNLPSAPCYRDEQLNKKDIIQRERLTRLANWLVSMGSPSASGLDTLTFGFYGLVLLYGVMYAFGYFSHRKRIMYIDWLTFMYYPEAEILRINHEMRSIIQTIIDNHLLENISVRFLPKKRDDASSINTLSRPLTTCSCKLKRYYHNQDKFMKQFMKENWLNYLIPDNLTASTMRYLIYRQYIVVLLCYGYAFLFGLTAATGFYYNELESCINERIEEIKCNSINSTYINKSLMLPDLTYKEREIYDKYLNGTLSLFSLLYQVEIGKLFTPKSVQIFVEAGFLFVVFAFGAGIQFVLVFGGLFTSVRWIEQIKDQLTICTELLRKLHINLNEEAKNQVEKALAITYINFMAFTRDHRNYRDYLRNCTTTITCILLSIFLLCYSLGMGNSSKTLPYGWAIICEVVVLLNVMGRISGYLNQKIQQVFALINDAMAKCSLNDMEFNYIVTLWRRQILTRQEVQNFYGVRVLEVRLTYSNLVKFNSYVLGFCLYLARAGSNIDK